MTLLNRDLFFDVHALPAKSFQMDRSHFVGNDFLAFGQLFPQSFSANTPPLFIKKQVSQTLTVLISLCNVLIKQLILFTSILFLLYYQRYVESRDNIHAVSTLLLALHRATGHFPQKTLLQATKSNQAILATKQLVIIKSSTQESSNTVNNTW